MNKTILYFVATTPKIYSSFDKFNLKLCEVFIREGWKPVFIFVDEICHKKIEEDLKAEGGIVEIIKYKNKILVFINTFKLYMKYKPKLVHVHFINYLKLINSIISIITNTKYVVSFRSLITDLSLTKYIQEKGKVRFYMLRIYFKILDKTSNFMFCNSEALRKQVIDILGYNSKKVQCLYAGVEDISRRKSMSTINELLPQFEFRKDVVLIGNVGAFEQLKGIETLVRAVDILVNRKGITNFKVIHVGGNRIEDEKSKKYNSNIYQLCKDFKIEGYLKFAGKKNNIYNLLPHFDIYVHPSHSEGLSQAVIEACSAKLPIVCSNTGGLPEIVFNGYNGFLTNIDDDYALAENMQHLISDKNERRRMGNNSYKVFQQNFYLKNQIDSYMGKINILIS